VVAAAAVVPLLMVQEVVEEELRFLAVHSGEEVVLSGLYLTIHKYISIYM
jgi:hypothetical protein